MARVTECISCTGFRAHLTVMRAELGELRRVERERRRFEDDALFGAAFVVALIFGGLVGHIK